jgi:solute:Na+ symporter, SSS family
MGTPLRLSVLDYSIVLAYLIGITIAGVKLAGRQRSPRDYFLGGKAMAWWAVGFSIVASETSTLTFISVPGLAYVSNMYFLQVAFGYFIGRLLVAFFFIPAYYRGDLETAYDFLGKRFGLRLRLLTSSLFLITRVLSSGVRLFATAIPVHVITGLSYQRSILLIGIFTVFYTYLGGLKAVVATDVVQLAIYLSSALASVILILIRLPNGWADVVSYSTVGVSSKFEMINLEWGRSLGQFLSSPYTLLGGLVGGTFLSMASHGTDQLLVQRLLGCKSARESQRALILDASLIVIQFTFFLLLGLCLFAYYRGQTLIQLGVQSSDEIFPKFIVETLPPGLAGLVVAGILASAMGTLSSSISSLAASSYLDLYRHNSSKRLIERSKEIAWSRVFTLFWGIVLVAGAMLFENNKAPVVVLGLKIASFTYGGMLGVFLLGILSRGANQKDATIGLICGIACMAVVFKFTTIGFTWHGCIGCVLTLGTAALSKGIRELLLLKGRG